MIKDDTAEISNQTLAKLLIVMLFFFGFLLAGFYGGRSYEAQRINNVLERATHKQGAVIYCPKGTDPSMVNLSGCFKVMGEF